jgi:hypothetical protein
VDDIQGYDYRLDKQSYSQRDKFSASKKELIFHRDQCSQYIRKRFGPVLEGFFGSLKHGWILEIAQPTREYMKQYDRA